MKIFTSFVAGVFVLFISASALAQADTTTDRVLDEIAGKFASMKTYRVDIRTQTITMGRPVVSEGVISFKAPDRIHITATSNTMAGAQEIFASDGVAYTYLPTMKTATQMDMGRLKAAGRLPEGISDFSDNALPFAGFPLDELAYIETKEANGRTVHVFVARPYYDAKSELAEQMAQDRPTPDMFGDTILFEVDAETGLLATMTVLAANGAVMMRHTYSNFRVNIPIDDAEFTFSPPADVLVTDLTDGTLSMMQQLQ
jgi:outer membrane lipoprotein-sorting protein